MRFSDVHQLRTHVPRNGKGVLEVRLSSLKKQSWSDREESPGGLDCLYFSFEIWYAVKVFGRPRGSLLKFDSHGLSKLS